MWLVDPHKHFIGKPGWRRTMSSLFKKWCSSCDADRIQYIHCVTMSGQFCRKNGLLLDLWYGDGASLLLRAVKWKTNIFEWQWCNNTSPRGIKAAERKTLLTPKHSLNAFSEPRPSRTLELVEASKSWLPILIVVVYKNWNLTYTTNFGIILIPY